MVPTALSGTTSDPHVLLQGPPTRRSDFLNSKAIHLPVEVLSSGLPYLAVSRWQELPLANVQVVTRRVLDLSVVLRHCNTTKSVERYPRASPEAFEEDGQKGRMDGWGEKKGSRCERCL